MDALVDAMKLLVDLRHTHTGRGRKVTRARARDTHGARAQARAREEQKSRWVETKLTCTRRRLTKDERVKRRAEAQRDPAMMDGQLERGEVQRKKSEERTWCIQREDPFKHSPRPSRRWRKGGWHAASLPPWWPSSSSRRYEVRMGRRSEALRCACRELRGLPATWFFGSARAPHRRLPSAWARRCISAMD